MGGKWVGGGRGALEEGLRLVDGVELAGLALLREERMILDTPIAMAGRSGA